MNIDDLKAFKKVCEVKSFTRAAEEMNFVQSNITAKVKRLEKHYQAQLIYRDKKAITATPAGHALLNYINQILTLVDAADAELIDNPYSELHIGSIETIAATRLPNVLEKFRQTNKQAKLKITTASTNQLLSKIKLREIEGAFLSGPVNDESIEAVPLYNEQMVVITQKGYGDPAYETKGQAIIVFGEGCFYRSYFEEWLTYHQITIDSLMTLNTLDGIVGCVQAGLGIAMLPQSVTPKLDYDKLDFYQVTTPFEHVPVSFIYRKDSVQTSVFNQFKTVMSAINK
ncbi:LysR family transcriptional regulator [Staphylococcus kloosii]|uniref:HTH-type transcriptional regulator YusT n=1 Tax=Staphylococcus kloosii TaxID=29384 RepID=A0ABQ0XJB0_9STAP|nr:LysR family transcriptional regulator [Staphylococcus kloosii]GEP81548.1 putative HTH-type transcriptional regulator YusT [Staphylococcus kloosii]SUM48153.1 LysR-family regulatory protein [Staphylococcus kloosii]